MIIEICAFAIRMMFDVLNDCLSLCKLHSNKSKRLDTKYQIIWLINMCTAYSLQKANE